MAPVDDKIAAARLEKQKSLKGVGTYQEVNAKIQDMGNQQVTAGVSSTQETAYRPPTMAEQADKNSQYHMEEHLKAKNAAYFLGLHPEFEEFIKLVRAGSIQFIVIAMCCVAAFGQTPPPAKTAPALSTAERTALQALEKQKQDAQQNFIQAQQAEGVIEQEYKASHAGFHVNPATFVVEADGTPAPAAPGAAVAPPAPVMPKLHRPTPATAPAK